MRTLVSTLEEVKENIRTLHKEVAAGNEKAKNLVGKGWCFVAVSTSGGTVFAPSRFVGYRDNDLQKHDDDDSKHGGKTNIALNRSFGCEPIADPLLEDEFRETYCLRWDISPESKTRKFWKKLDGVLELVDEQPLEHARSRECSSAGPSPYERERELPTSPGRPVSGLHREMQGLILAAAKTDGWHVVSVHTDEVVLPDLAVIRDHQIVLFEVKSSSQLADVYQGVGQLLLYQQWFWPGRADVHLVLVLPEPGALVAESRRKSLSSLNAHLLTGSGDELRKAVHGLLKELK